MRPYLGSGSNATGIMIAKAMKITYLEKSSIYERHLKLKLFPLDTKQVHTNSHTEVFQSEVHSPFNLEKNT